MLIGVSNHSGDPRQSCYLFRRALRVAPGDYDFAFGIFASNTANGGARVLVSGGGNGTRVQNDNVGFAQSSCRLQPTFKKLALYSGTIGLRRSTAKILYVKTCHSHIVT
jgi:hypothetical protein